MLSSLLRRWKPCWPRPGVRGYATQLPNDPSKFRNMALVAHIDSGKTTLTESILLKSEYLAQPGTVDTGSTTTDFLPAERERGITIQSASIPVKWKDWTFNLIDTPGHADFGMEVESASRVVDGAVVLIDSVEGVEAQTKGVWKQLDRYGVSTRIMFLNKLDRPGASFKSSLTSLLTNRFHPNPLALVLPIASFDPADYDRAEPGIQGLVDLVNWEVWKWDEAGEHTRHTLPRTEQALSQVDCLPSNHPILGEVVTARTAMLDNLSMFSEPLMETLLSSSETSNPYLEVPAQEIKDILRTATLKNDILPVVGGAAFRHIGTDIVMNFVGELLASPLDVEHEKQIATSPTRMLAWKVMWDKRRGWMTFVRVYSGKVKKQSGIMNTTRNQKERISKILLLYADQAEEVDELPFGSVGVILGLKYTRTGDTLESEASESHLRSIVPPPAVVSASVIPQSHADLAPVQAALESLARTDPSVRIDVQEGQLLVHGMGTLHLEIVEGRLRDEFEARFELGKRYVSYRETLSDVDTSSVSNVWTSPDMHQGRPFTVTVDLEMRPLEDHEPSDPAWDGNVALDAHGRPLPPPETLGTSPEAYIGQGIASALSSSPHTSLAFSRVFLKIKKLNFIPKLATYLTPAAAWVVRERIKAAGMGPVMEPYVDLKVSVTEDALGKVVKDLTEHGGEVLDMTGGSGSDVEEPYPADGVYVPPEWVSPSGGTAAREAAGVKMKRAVQAVAPLSRMLDYSNRLRALSGGHGLFEMSPAGFRKVNEARKMEILREIGRA
ncbi:P-loop containing nucleoside triphosphate hydrolase protein [Schizophyllum commune H4-8]|uniref:Tr-type G domain-containing protein n=1 Tax=Schizophyllum commune (strain H4-8 / FGSC 9210) TaxID=578458 RepID=D8PPL2_SCHCM|nr:P-loop containing nucleoside triphosphate hydrolase protein [Schizophyllum commune H4-8]KAI5893466.1 P-loop containing nucleoside triphosphate hydrolase protein [Schizophyllum commune H4-8]